VRVPVRVRVRRGTLTPLTVIQRLAHTPVVPETVTETLTAGPQPVVKLPVSNKPPAVKAAVIARRTAGHGITQIAKDLRVSRPTVYKILAESQIDDQLSNWNERAKCVVPLAFDAVEHQLKDKQDGNLGIRYLEDMGVIGANAAQHRQPDAGITNAIQMLIQPGASVLVGGGGQTVGALTDASLDVPASELTRGSTGEPSNVDAPPDAPDAPDAQGEAAENPPTTSARAKVRP